MHDQTAIRTEGLPDLLHHYPGVRIWADEGYRGLSRDHPGQVYTKQPQAPETAPTDLQQHLHNLRKLHCQQRIPIEQVIGRMKNWRTLAHWPGRRDTLPETITAIAALVSDHTATR
jgi:hypothetical protein